jgi:hypothetical protein
MMKRALLHSIEPGRICDVVDMGKEFEVHENFAWVDVPDDTTNIDRWDIENNCVIKFNPLEVPGFAETAYLVARGIEYGAIGTQLDMLYHELKNTGTISNTGPWATHIATVKSNIPKDDPAAVLAWNIAQFNKNSGG